MRMSVILQNDLFQSDNINRMITLSVIPINSVQCISKSYNQHDEIKKILFKSETQKIFVKLDYLHESLKRSIQMKLSLLQLVMLN
jgi:hypothetical protein